ncbi:WecB/TagA/CpsF family glycosyltransferase [Limoniibacter endophyticus]|uniref:UDP-N-acetyl-D-mannosaminuronic acid transferase n=1 Tax=Limoniibacter endophyticus TaxID=1565040 RepID=A0A8J3DMI2_9HYPH|nr:WecB/TagA/CpsF family glycosyltransferase [Limoniibacter endophyticus]GHC67607.1 UDP-N-acetyl-D-mannosaminuronic acid transferase [Limoniibacter endophyticus]
MTTPDSFETVDILGVRVIDASQAEMIMHLSEVVARRAHLKLAFANAHLVNQAAARPDFRGALKAFDVVPDGIGVDLAARLLRGRNFRNNLNGTDFVPAFLQAHQTSLRVALLGAQPNVLETAHSRLSERFPQHKFISISDGYFTAPEEEVILKRLAVQKPDILIVAMGVPRQEMWIANRIDVTHACVAMGVGALFDFLSENVTRAPVWMRKARLEWVYRLYLEPKRLWRRYILGNPLFLARVARQRLGFRSGVGDP